MTIKQPDFSDLNALAIEACDMWQEHLSNLASNPEARAELTRYLEPQRRLFADWAATLQQGATQQRGSHEPHRTKTESTAQAKPTPTSANAASSPAPATPRGTAHGDDSLRIAQLALRVAELEKRLGQLEAGLTGSPGQTAKSGAARRTQRSAS